MDNVGDGNPPAGGDQRQKDSSISLAASSMISGSDMITQEAYQANLKRIQEVKEMVRRLEMNNEAAHKNFLVDQLEKRAKDGRDAENLLARLRNPPGLSEAVQFPNNIPGGKPEVILPTTATLVEVPEPRSSPHSLPAPTTASVQQGHPAEFPWSPLPQAQSYGAGIFPYHSAPHQHLYPNIAPPSMAPLNGEMGWYPTQTQPGTHSLANRSGFRPRQAQQPSQSTITLPATGIVPTPGHYASPAGSIRTAPAQIGTTTYREPSFPIQSTTSGSVNRHSHNIPLHTPNSQALQGIVAPPTSSQPLPAQSQPMPVGSRFRFVSTVVTPELQRLPKPAQRPQTYEQSPPQPHPLPQPLPHPHSWQLQRQPPTLPQTSLQSHRPTQSQEPSQWPLHLPQMDLLVPPQPADRISSNVVSQDSQPIDKASADPVARLQQPGILPEQARQRGPQPRVDKATFIKLFQIAVRRGILQLKAFWFQAKVSGVSDEWCKAAINSLPRDVRESIMAQVNQLDPNLGASSPASVAQQEVAKIPSSNVSVDAARPRLTAIPPPLAPPVTQRSAKPSTFTEGNINTSAPGQTSTPYAAQLQYYAEQATKSALCAQVVDNSATPAIITPTHRAVKTPTRAVPLAPANVRTPEDANKSTLARDILRSLGKIVPPPGQEVGGDPMGEPNNYEGDQSPEDNPPRPVSHIVPPALPPTSFSNPPSTATPTPQHVSSSQAVLIEEREKIEGPIMIDLTLEADESADGKGQEPEPIRMPGSTATFSQPISTTNTTNDTPLLENLTLEESPVDVPANGENLDARMYSPPPSLAARTNTEFKRLSPLLGNAEPVPPSSEPLPREASEQPQLPLFLPSPPVSPSHAELPETDLETINGGDKSGPFLKRRSVDEMEVDVEVATPSRVRKRRKQQVYVLIPPAPLYVTRAMKKMKGRALEKVNSDLEGAGGDEEFQYSHLEQLLIEESKFRLLERRCRWLNCGAILNCAANLLAHLKVHAREEDSQAPFLCRWANCEGRFVTEQERSVHFERHTIRPLPCPFAGCDERFDKPVEVMEHEVQHQKTEQREPLVHKSTCQPVVPAIPARLGAPPHQVASHRVIPRRVVKCRISADRQAILGPWILWNIFSPVELSTRKQNASMRGRTARQAIGRDGDIPDMRRDDYDFLLALSSYPTKNVRLDDLDSAVITASAARGLTLWGGDEVGEEDVVGML